MNRKQRAVLEQIFARPARANVRWSEIESLFRGLGATVSQGSGSRVRVELNDRRATFHRPHPSPFIDKGALRVVRMFLENVGATP